MRRRLAVLVWNVRARIGSAIVPGRKIIISAETREEMIDLLYDVANLYANADAAAFKAQQMDTGLCDDPNCLCNVEVPNG